MNAGLAAPQTASFRLTLTTYADPAAMGDWMRRAQPGDEMIYAIGPAIGDHEAARCARSMADRRLVELFQRRSGRPHCFEYCARKLEVSGHAPTPIRQSGGTTGGDHTRGQLRTLLGLLRKAAEQGEPCPSHSDTAKQLGLPRGERGRRRSKYLFDRLASENRIAVTHEGTVRVVTITAKGRAHGKSTGGKR